MNKKILLVEDDALLQKLYSDLLLEDAYALSTAADGVTAYEKIKQGNWDLILLDIMLPKMSGVEIVRKLNNTVDVNHTGKIVFLTNLDTGSEIDEIKKLGYDFIIKSNLAPDQFVAKVKSYLSP